MRLVEQANPGVAFDWERILKGEGSSQDMRPRPEPMPERRARPRFNEDSGRGASTSNERAAAVVPPASSAAASALLQAEEVTHPPSDALTRLGAEGLARLRARYDEVVARIAEKISDPSRRDELKTQADRLNPDSWGSSEAVTAGLEQYETVFESLRTVVGRRRKRRRRPDEGGPGGGDQTAPPADESDHEPDRGPEDNL